MTNWKWAVTFEFDVDAPITERGLVSASSPSTACARAMKLAKKARPRTQAASYCILLERVES